MTTTTTDATLYATYKVTAPGLDLRFFVDHTHDFTAAMGVAVSELLKQIQPDGRLAKGVSRPAFYRTLKNLQDEWRQLSNRTERADKANADAAMYEAA